MVPANRFVLKMLFSLFTHSCMIWRLRVRVWTVIRFSSSRSPALWDTDTSSSTRAHSYQIFSGVYALQTAAICTSQYSVLTKQFFFILWVRIQVIFRIVPGGVILTFCSRSLTNSRGDSNLDWNHWSVLNQQPCLNTEIWFYLKLLVMIF